jgi:hypothetical protein
MELLRHFLGGITLQPFKNLLALLALPPDHLFSAIALLGAFIIVCELTRIVLALELTRSVLVHVTICLLTFALQSLVLAFVLAYGAHNFPGRAWINLAIVTGLYALWYITGQTTRLVRKDSEGADVGFMTVGAMITFPVGIIAAILA